MTTYNPNDSIKIDTNRLGRKVFRHVATIDNKGAAHTKCNRHIVAYWTAEKEDHAERVSYFYTNGERYSTPCKICLPEDYKEMQS